MKYTVAAAIFLSAASTSIAYATEFKGTWKGRFECGGERIGLSLEILDSHKFGLFSVRQRRVGGTLNEGLYTFTFEPNGDTLVAKPKDWLQKTEIAPLAGFTVRRIVNGAGHNLRGTIDHPGCDALQVKRESTATPIMDDAFAQQNNQNGGGEGGDGRQYAKESAFAGMGWEIGSVPLGMDFQSTMRIAAPGQKLKTRTWAAKSGTVFDKPIAPHTDYEGINFGVTNIRAVSDRTMVRPTHWHTGHLVWHVEKSVKSSNPELMPSEDSLLAAVTDKFGQAPSQDSVVYGRGGVGQRGWDIVGYPIRNGAVVSGQCSRIDTSFSRTMSTSRERYQAYRELLQKIDTGNHCEGLFAVMYTEGRMGRLREYKLIARDFRLEAMNAINDFETRARLLREHQNAMPEVAPKL